MHDKGAVTPVAVVSPRSEWGVSQSLKLLKDLNLHHKFMITVKSGGHGYLHRQPTDKPVILLNLKGLNNHFVAHDTLTLEPGCLLGQVIYTLNKHRKAVPHGDCFDVGAGGHFTTAGWDLLLTRKYGLGCQSIVSGRVALWDGTVVAVDEKNHPQLLHALRGGAAAGAGVATEVCLKLVDEPAVVSWAKVRLTREQLVKCAEMNVFSNATKLPREITPSFKFYFELGEPEPVAAFRIGSILSKKETIASVREHLGEEVVAWLPDDSDWNEKKMVDYRLQVAPEPLASNVGILAEATSAEMLERPLDFWKPANAAHEMLRSYIVQTSTWVVPECEEVLPTLYDGFGSIKNHPMHERMYSLVILGDGTMNDLADSCSMPVGRALIRFESHWDDDETYGEDCHRITREMGQIIQTKADTSVERPYRGDIWLREQGTDPKLDQILQRYDRR